MLRSDKVNKRDKMARPTMRVVSDHLCLGSFFKVIPYFTVKTKGKKVAVTSGGKYLYKFI